MTAAEGAAGGGAGGSAHDAAGSRAREIGSELRRLIELSVDRTAVDEAGALAHLRAAAELLDGPHRPRFYERIGEVEISEVPAEFLAFGPFGGRSNPLGPPVRIAVTEVDGHQAVEAKLTFGSAYEGAPHWVHGGFVAAVLDDVFGMAQHQLQVTAATGSLKVRYVAPTPIRKELTFRAWFEQVTGRRLHGKATCHDGDTLTATAEVLMITVDMRAVAERARRPDTASGSG